MDTYWYNIIMAMIYWYAQDVATVCYKQLPWQWWQVVSAGGCTESSEGCHGDSVTGQSVTAEINIFKKNIQQNLCDWAVIIMYIPKIQH